jgi:hypothetical protein
MLFVEVSMACPGCAGSMDDPYKGNIVYILGGFILLTYIPFYLIYRTIIKNKNFNQKLEDGRPE